MSRGFEEYEVVSEAIERIAVYEETQADAIRFLVAHIGIDLETARKAVSDAAYVLKQIRGYA